MNKIAKKIQSSGNVIGFWTRSSVIIAGIMALLTAGMLCVNLLVATGHFSSLSVSFSEKCHLVYAPNAVEKSGQDRIITSVLLKNTGVNSISVIEAKLRVIYRGKTLFGFESSVPGADDTAVLLPILLRGGEARRIHFVWGMTYKGKVDDLRYSWLRLLWDITNTESPVIMSFELTDARDKVYPKEYALKGFEVSGGERRFRGPLDGIRTVAYPSWVRSGQPDELLDDILLP